MNEYLAKGKPRRYVASNHEDWLKLRQGIGSSDVATILGLNKFSTPYQLWLQKTGKQPKTEENFLMMMGHKLEPIIADLWASETGNKIVEGSEEEYIYVHPEIDYLRVSPDREFYIDGQKNGILECKSTQLKITADELPAYWFCQVQYQLGVAQLEKANIAWLISGREFGRAEITFNKEFFAYEVEQVKEFWEKNVLGGIEPEVSTVEDVTLRYTRSMDKPFEASQHLLESYQQLKEINERAKSIANEKERLEDEIKLAMSECDRLTYEGQTLATWKSAKDGQKFDEARFKSENPELYAKYVVSKAGSRRFLLK